MAVKSSKPQRGLADIKTVAGRSSDRNKRSYANYFKMGALELERWRRAQERKAAADRVAEVDRRLRDIDGEMQALQDGLPPLSTESPAAARRRPGADRRTSAEHVTTTRSQRTEQPAGERRGLRLKY